MGQSAPELTARLLRHERALIASAIVILAALGWLFLLRGMAMDAMELPLTALVTMWWLMMFAMMLPSAAPAILLYARVRAARGGGLAIAHPLVFSAGYLWVWLLFSVAAAFTQPLLTDSSMAVRNHTARAAVLTAAGVYQLTPLKSACLSRCRSPGQFISQHWRPGWLGAMRLGALHGAYCVGCCWMLMTLLFVGGVMNLLWVIGLTALVASEKILAQGRLLQKVSGGGLICWGLIEAFT